MEIYADTSSALRIAALQAQWATIAERWQRTRYAGADGSMAMSPETKSQQAMAQQGAIMAAEADTRLAKGVLAVAGTVPGQALDIRV